MEDKLIKHTLSSAKTIAMVGVSSVKKEEPSNIKRRPSIIVMKYLQEFGYHVIPVNPFSTGQEICGEKVFSCLEDINIPIVLRVSSGNSILNEDMSNEKLCVSIEEAIRLNVSAVAFSIYVGAEHEHQTLVEFSKLVNEAHRFGLPVLAVTAVGKDMERDLRYLSLASRMAAELGADIVKTYFCDQFDKLVSLKKNFYLALVTVRYFCKYAPR